MSISKYYLSILLVILGFAFLSRVYRLSTPEGYIFDEVYHAITAKLIARNDARAYEWWNEPVEPNTAVDWLHPPFAKYTQAASILVFGENALGWRFSSVIFGVLTVWMTATLARKLFENESIALLAALFASLDGLILTQSRIAMNDIHVTFFILTALVMYGTFSKNRLRKMAFKDNRRFMVLTGIFTGLAMGSKWSGLFLLPLFFILEIAWLLLQSFHPKISFGKDVIKKYLPLLPWYLLSFVMIPAIIYLSAYTQMFLQGKSFQHFKDLHEQIWWYQTNLEASHDYQSRPSEWVLNMRPVWYHVEYDAAGNRGDIYAFGNTALFWFGLIAVIITLLKIIRSIGSETKEKELLLSWSLLLLISAYLFVWAPWIASPRIMFFYHYTPAVPLLSINLSYWLYTLSKKGSPFSELSVATVGLIALVFVVWYPHWVGLPVGQFLKEDVYFYFSRWR